MLSSPGPTCRLRACSRHWQSEAIRPTPQHKLPEQQPIWVALGAQTNGHRKIFVLQVLDQTLQVEVPLCLFTWRRPFSARQQELLPIRWCLRMFVMRLGVCSSQEIYYVSAPRSVSENVLA